MSWAAPGFNSKEDASVTKNLIVAICLGATAWGCAHNVVALGPAGQGVTIVNVAPLGCTELGEVFGKSNADDMEEAMLGARSDLRNRAGAKGASHVVLETNNSRRVTGDWEPGVEILLGGRAVRCSEK